jgi:hypothetical protein
MLATCLLRSWAFAGTRSGNAPLETSWAATVALDRRMTDPVDPNAQDVPSARG